LLLVFACDFISFVFIKLRRYHSYKMGFNPLIRKG
jgi:hypothetical protein